MKLSLKKSGQIYIPKSLREVLDFRIGDYINVFLDGKQIVLSKKEGYDKEIKCTYNQKGTIHIPAEIRRLSNIDTDAVFTITIDEKEKRVCLIPDLTG